MISQQEKQVVERSDGISESTFKIKASAKAFQILSSGLYSDKVRAIVRELSANAYDSHVEAKNPNPFLVHVPNMLEPFFFIRDFGTGISPENIFTIYTTYFDSTRSDSNAMVGMMGLGSKSPFSYVDNFTVTSWYQGVKSIYTAFVNEDGIPCITKLLETPSTDPSGLEVRFPVKSSEFNRFRERVGSVYTYFKIQPTILGDNITLPKPSYFLKSANWGVRTGAPAYGGHCLAVMGNIAYPVSYPDSDLDENQLEVLKQNIDIFFNIGVLDVSASRESISYDKQTKAAMKAKLATVAEELKQEINSKIQTCASLWDARVLVYSMRKGEYASLNSFINNMCKDITWQSVKVFDGFTNVEHVDLRNLAQVIEVKSFVKGNSHAYRRRNAKPTLEESNFIAIKDNILFLIQDVHKNVIPRCVKKVSENATGLQIYLITSLVDDGLKQFKQLLGMSDNVEFPLLTSLPYDPVVSTANYVYNPKNAAAILVWNGNCSSEASENWTKETVDLNAGGFYLPIDRYEVVNIGNVGTYINSINDLLKIAGVPLPKVYGVKTREIDRIRTLSQWKCFTQFARESLQKFIDSSNLDELSCYKDALENDYNNAVTDSSDRILWKTIIENLEYFGEIPELKLIVQKQNQIGYGEDPYPSHHGTPSHRRCGACRVSAGGSALPQDDEQRYCRTSV
jgi:hypothetical protein